MPPPLPPRKSEEKVAKKPVQKSGEDKPQKVSVQAGKGSNKTGKSTGNKDKVIDEQKVVADLAKKQESESELEETLKGKWLCSHWKKGAFDLVRLSVRAAKLNLGDI